MTHRHPRPRCRPPPLSLTHMHKYTNTPTHILISTSNLHSFRNISPVFSSPAEQMLAVCVSLPLDCTNRLPEVFFLFFCTASLLFSELSSQAVCPRPFISALWFRCWSLLHLEPLHPQTLSSIIQTFLPWMSSHVCGSVLAQASSSIYHKMFLRLFPRPDEFSPQGLHAATLLLFCVFFSFFFNLSSAVWRLFTAPSVRNTSVSVSTGLLLCFDIRYFCLASSPLARLFARHPHTQVAIITYSQFSCCEM